MPKDWYNVINPPIVGVKEEDMFCHGTWNEIIERNMFAIHLAANAPSDKTLEEYYRTLDYDKAFAEWKAKS
jgi:hypothetical protein